MSQTIGNGAVARVFLVVEVCLYVELGRNSGQDSLISVSTNEMNSTIQQQSPHDDISGLNRAATSARVTAITSLRAELKALGTLAASSCCILFKMALIDTASPKFSPYISVGCLSRRIYIWCNTIRLPREAPDNDRV